MKDTVLITGASSGIGAELARIFAKKGHDLILVARSKQKLVDLKKDIQGKGKITILIKDLGEKNAAEAVYNAVKKEYVHIDILVNNAGFGDYGLFIDSAWKKQEQMITLNITTLTHLTHLFVQDMVANNYGRIMNVASTAAFQPGPLMSVYFATKAYVLSFSEALANELQGSGITVTTLCPGPTTSGFQKEAHMEQAKIVQGNLPAARDVAQFGYSAVMSGKRVAVHGWKNKLLVLSTRFVPRSWVLGLVRRLQEK